LAPVRIAKQAIYCSNYIIYDVVLLYQTTAHYPVILSKRGTTRC